MILVYRDAILADAVDAAVPEAATLFSEWTDFKAAVRRASFLVVVFERAEPPHTEDALRAVGQLMYPPLILVMPPTLDNLGVLARITCHGCVPLQEIDRRLADMIQSAAAESPRRRAARAILQRHDVKDIGAAIVCEVLQAREPVRNVQALERTLGQPSRKLRDAWNRVRPRSEFRLYRLVRWGRLLRTVEYLEAGATIMEAAIMIGVDESTLYRDFVVICGEAYRNGGTYDSSAAAAALLRELEVGIRVGRPAASVSNDAAH